SACPGGVLSGNHEGAPPLGFEPKSTGPEPVSLSKLAYGGSGSRNRGGALRPSVGPGQANPIAFWAGDLTKDTVVSKLDYRPSCAEAGPRIKAFRDDGTTGRLRPESVPSRRIRASVLSGSSRGPSQSQWRRGQPRSTPSS